MIIMSKDTYNLTLIQQNAINADCLSHTAFIASTYYQLTKSHYRRITAQLQRIIKDQSNNNYYTRNKSLFLAYIRYCFNSVCEVVA